MLRLAEARGLPIHQKPAKTRFHELKMRLSPLSTSHSIIRLYCSIGIDLMDSSPWFKFRGLFKMLSQLSQAEASWVIGNIDRI